ncbi:Gfo/Idh/MocA family protein [Breznakiella homolactica]|uniref:Gfo/Idh/MocA family oxidoreductase n=1 Tax=Breznakiella homolactica TaxID=2798577 RepID=A0A7T7XNE9_9SPIR|nr:Gfo/Idh/MocA family oxidoreductase [Breznakiella homolactica]QQO09503.1 Gfo/Idh/MocA family oxidoreductase [Breznakiella homolactica]
MERIRTAVIGLGMMGFAQIRNCFSAVDDFEITAVCDNHEPNLVRAVEWFKSKGQTVESYTDWRELLDKADFDLAVIVTPDFLHEEMAAACLDAGKHLRLEKPMATTVEGCRRIIDAWKRCPRIVQVGFELRYSNLIVRMREQQERLGNLRMVWCHEFRHPFLKKEGSTPDWIIQKKYSGGTLLEKNCHHFDLFNMIARAKPVSVYASGDNKTIYAATDVLDNAFVTVEYENGIRAMLSLCLFSPEKKGQKHLHALEVGLLGDRGRMEMRDDDLYFWDRECMNEERISFLRENCEAHAEDIIPSLRELAQCIRENRQPYTDLCTGLNSTLVALAAEQSAAEKRIVTIAEMEQRYGVLYGIC